MEKCIWCNEETAELVEGSVYWELPDGTRAIEITHTPTLLCSSCGAGYQSEDIVRQIEDQLFLINTSEVEDVIRYRELLAKPRLLKRNYFDFS